MLSQPLPVEGWLLVARLQEQVVIQLLRPPPSRLLLSRLLLRRREQWLWIATIGTVLMRMQVLRTAASNTTKGRATAVAQRQELGWGWWEWGKWGLLPVLFPEVSLKPPAGVRRQQETGVIGKTPDPMLGALTTRG